MGSVSRRGSKVCLCPTISGSCGTGSSYRRRMEISRILLASRSAPAGSEGSAPSDLTARNIVSQFAKRTKVSGRRHRDGVQFRKNHDELAMISNRHIDVLVGQSPEKIGIPHVRLPR